MGQIIKDQKEINRKISYEDISSDLENNPEFSYRIDKENIESEQIIIKFLNELEIFVKRPELTENEVKLGHALYVIFENYDQIFVGSDNNKFNKNIILLTLRDMTNLSTKEIRGSMKKYKVMYAKLIQAMVK